MQDKRRFATPQQRQAAFVLANGCCQMCGTELQPDWHCDHVKPWVHGGETDILNLQALCPACNLRKGATEMAKIDLRPHQKNAINKLSKLSRPEGEVNYFDPHVQKAWATLDMCVASGKTILGATVAKLLLEERVVDRVIVVCPAGVISGWHKAFICVGVQGVTANPTNGSIIFGGGYVTSFSAVNANCHVHRQRSMQGKDGRAIRTLVIIDEVHHLAEGDNEMAQQWGASHKIAFGDATRILCLSGTPFRTRRQESIPFCQYEPSPEGGYRLQADFHYSITDGVKDKFLRIPHFSLSDGVQRFEIAPRHDEEDVNEEGRVPWELTLVDAEQEGLSGPALLNYITEAYRDAIDIGYEYLNELKKSDPRAKILIIGDNKNHAESIKSYAATKSSGEPCVIVSDSDEGASGELIDRFRSSDRDTCVSIDIVSEGVDIPDLRVLVYLCRKRTLTRLFQVSGRVMRVRGTDPLGVNDFCHIVFPDIHEFRVFADGLVGDIQHELDEEPREAREGGLPPPRRDVVTLAGEASVTGIKAHSDGSVQDLCPHELRAAQAYCQRMMPPTAYGRLRPVDLIGTWRMSGSVAVEAETVEETTIDTDALTADYHSRLNSAVKSIFSTLADLVPKEGDWKGELNKSINFEINRQAGVLSRAKGKIDIAGLQKCLDAAEVIKTTSAIHNRIVSSVIAKGGAA